MGTINKKIRITPLKKISLQDGDVYHAMKKTDPDFVDFGEAYFSWINFRSIKGWKMHKRMIMNLVVPFGKVKFVFTTDNGKTFSEEIIGSDNYSRLTIHPLVWVAFQGLEYPSSPILNLASIEHDPVESDVLKLESFNYKWQ